MDNTSKPASKQSVPKSDGCDFYLLGFGKHTSGCGQVNITDRPPQFGVFFDGTGNNAANDLARRDDEKEPTNVFKLHELYPREDRHFINKTYIPGVGTEAGQDDNDIDMGIAYTFGDKVRQALADAQEFFSNKNFTNAPLGILDIFGFSRGAAAARHFVNEIHRLCKTDPKYFGGPQLQIRFLGLFDTVGSIGTAGDNSQTLPSGESFNLELNPQAVQYAYHLTARHEQREYFPLNSILTGPHQSPATHFEEVELPGAHSDVGGGYGATPDIVYYPAFTVEWSSNTQRNTLIELKRHEYEQRYHIPGIFIDMKILTNTPINGSFVSSGVYPEWRRHVKPHLAHAALHQMHAKAREKGVPLEPLDMLTRKAAFEGRRAEDVYGIPADLQQHFPRLQVNPNDTLVEDDLFRHYIHHSHQYRAKPKPWAAVTVNSSAPEQNPRRVAPNGTREIFYNQAAKGYSPQDRWKRLAVRRDPWKHQDTARWVRE